MNAIHAMPKNRVSLLLGHAATRLRQMLPSATLIITMLLLGFVPDSDAAEPDHCAVFRDLSDDQITTLVHSYWAGKPEGFGLTLAAIAWRESMAGEVLINHADPSFGPFHANIRSASVRAKAETTFRQNLVAQRLIDDFDYAAWHALEELKYWQSQYGEDWQKIWASYNGGWNYRSPDAQDYAKDIRYKVVQLRTCLLVG